MSGVGAAMVAFARELPMGRPLRQHVRHGPGRVERELEALMAAADTYRIPVPEVHARAEAWLGAVMPRRALRRGLRRGVRVGLLECSTRGVRLAERARDAWGELEVFAELPRDDRLPTEFEALIAVIEPYPLPALELRRRAQELLGQRISTRTFRRHYLRAVETGCAEETATGLRLPCDTLSSDQRVRDAIEGSRMLKEDGYERGDV
ncbi:MAG: hypothetical protein ACX94C_11695 [Phycisphaerales bacterium]